MTEIFKADFLIDYLEAVVVNLKNAKNDVLESILHLFHRRVHKYACTFFMYIVHVILHFPVMLLILKLCLLVWNLR